MTGARSLILERAKRFQQQAKSRINKPIKAINDASVFDASFQPVEQPVKKQKLNDHSENALSNETNNPPIPSQSVNQSNQSNEPDSLEAYMRQLTQSNKPQPMDESSDSDQIITQNTLQTERFYNDDECALDEAELDELGQKIFDNDAINQSIKQTKKLKKKEIHPINQSNDHPIDLPPIKKNFWREHPDITSLSDDQIADIRSLGDQTVESINQLLNPHKPSGQTVSQSINQFIKIRGDQCPRPFTHWSQCGLPLRIQDLVSSRSFSQPFSIQRQAIPVLMSGRDLIATASTGSGKTLAYVLSIVRHCMVQREVQATWYANHQINSQTKDQSATVEDEQSATHPIDLSTSPVGLILAPTRELASQIHDEVRMFASAVGLQSVNVSGGSSIHQSINQLKKGVDIIVATPGRLIDILSLNKGRVLSLIDVSMVVLDEADRMFDSGFEPQISKIFSLIRNDRQIAMFSATFPLAIEKFARKMLRNQSTNQATDASLKPLGPIELTVGGRSTVSSNINQSIEVRSEESKFSRLLELLGRWSTAGSIIIFVERQSSVDQIYQSIYQSANYSAIALHANMDQDDRESNLVDFKLGFAMDQMITHQSSNQPTGQSSDQLTVVQQPNILITTSVLARGLDVPHCVLVINYDAPNHYEDYVHRVGRTGRAGRRGVAITFVRPDQVLQAQMLAKALVMSGQEIPHDLQALIDASNLTKGDQSIKRLDGFHRSKGYRFDETEEAEHREAERMRRMADHPDVDQQELAQMKEELEVKKKSSNTSSISQSTSQSTSNVHSLPPPPPPPADPLAAQKAAIKAAALAASLSKTQSSSVEQATLAAQLARSNTEKIAATAAHEVAAERARALAASLAARAAAAHAQTQAANSSTRVKLTLQINDYPQAARWAVTKKGSLDDVLESTGCNVISKGVYIAPGQQPKAGQEKLFLMIEGDNEQETSKVRNEIQRRLDLVAAEQGQRESNAIHNTQGRIQGRYEVMRIKDR